MRKDIHHTLERFGHDSFRKGQEDAINHLLAGRHALVVLPTGIGKSLIYQIAAHHSTGVTLVISPLIALMKDQVDKLSKLNIPATFINSTLTQDEQLDRIEQMVQGKYKLVYVAPERLRQYFFREDIGNVKVGLLAVDEAHCISHWGHDFRPDYLYIKHFREFVGNPVTAALTATATPRVKGEIQKLLGIDNAQKVTTGFDRPNIKIEIEEVTSYRKREAQKLALIANQLEDWKSGTAIIYVGRRNDAEFVSRWISETLGYSAEYYHGGLGGSERAEIQDRFMSGRSPLVVATNAFGMGIDRADVRLIVHHTFPGSIESYYQEVGRAGRDEKPSKATMLFDDYDQSLHEYFIECSTLTYEDLRNFYEYLVELAGDKSSVWVRLYWPSKRFHWDEQGTKARVGLERLEQAGTIVQDQYDGFDRLIHIRNWDESKIESVLSNLQSHILHRRSLLKKMMDYGQNDTRCRRRIILNYFGDKSSLSRNGRCCDVCDTYHPIAKPKTKKKKQQNLEEQILSISEATSKHPTMAHWLKRQKTKSIEEKIKTAQTKQKKKRTIRKKKDSQPITKTDQKVIFKKILGCAVSSHGKLTKQQVTLVLVGSTSKKASHLAKHSYYGSLRGMSKKEITLEVNKLIEMNYLACNSSGKVIPGPNCQ